MKYFGLSFRASTIVPACAAGIALLIALPSERLRRSLKVFLSKHFPAQKHDYRQTWLHLTRKLASYATAGDMEKAVPDAYREIFGLREASLYLLDARTGRYVQTGQGASVRGSFLPSPGLRAYFQERNRIWDPADGEYAPTDEESSFARASQARLIVPLIWNHTVEGLLVLGGPVTASEDCDLMKIIAQESALLLSNLRLSEELMEARELAARARVSSFVVHDLKNLTHTLSLIMDNAEEHIGNAEFQRDMMITIRHTLGNMKKLTQKLKGFPGNAGPDGECKDIRLLCETIVQDFAKARPGAAIVCRGDSVFCPVDAKELKKAIVNLIQNALDASGGQGTIIAETGLRSGRACLRVSDNGCGMTQDFIQRQLFKPFRSTKQTGLGIGLYQCRQIVESFGGTIEVTSESGKGSCFTVYLPVSNRSLSLVP